MKKNILIIMVLFFCNVYSQNYKIGIATYEVKVGYDDWFKSVPKEMQDVFIKENESKRYQLQFKDSLSKFYVVNTVDVNDESYYFKSHNSNYSLRFINDSDFGKLIIKYNRDNNWELLNETKKILNFNCYKAISYYEEVRNNVKVKHPLIAWYCPEIPLKFGPFGYSLPGLIFEFQDRNITYGITKIDFKTKDIEISKPVNGKKITESEYIQMIRNLFSEN